MNKCMTFFTMHKDAHNNLNNCVRKMRAPDVSLAAADLIPLS